MYAAPRIFYSLVFYVLVMLAIMITKPHPMFDTDGQVRGFGVQPPDTLFTLGVVTILVAIIGFYVFAFIDIMFP